MRVPASTYRLQVSAEQDLFAAAALVPQLRRAGADWVYLSPILPSVPGSTHGYDVIAHDDVDQPRGGRAGLDALVAAARAHGMGVLVDIVPNHVGVQIPKLNRLWWDTLQGGPDAHASAAFDIDWAAGGGRVRIPVVGDDDLTDDGILHLGVQDGELRYHDHAFPLRDGTADGTPDEVHAQQHYELVSWRTADDQLNYRRFFTITDLAGVRVEEPWVFDHTHREVWRWFADGLVDGLRIDHPDGLAAPGAYLDQLAERTGGAYVVVEKILEPGERLPESWATAGTTGYDALGMIDRVLVDPAGDAPLTDLEQRLRRGLSPLWSQLTHGTRRFVADTQLRAEVLRIERDVLATTEHAPSGLDAAIAELLACMPVYRSYLPLGREHLLHAAREAVGWRPDLTERIQILLPILQDPTQPAAIRFQQTSGMVMAKGVEDTAFYRTARLASLAEVGGDPSVFSVAPDEFHTFAADRQQHWPHALNALTTHDTKRGEDVRARLAALAEVPGEWAELLDVLDGAAPLGDRVFASFVLQAAVGAWPIDRARLSAYAEKAARESDARTSWTDQNVRFEDAVERFVGLVTEHEVARRFIEEFVQRIDRAWRSNAVAARVLQALMPGVPDIYQGSERWQLSLVDPDNRRPVDWRAIADGLDALDAGTRPRLFDASVDEGALAKQHITREALRVRRDHPDRFTDYRPLRAGGSAAPHALAFDRGGVIAVVTRLPIGLAERGGWGDTVLALPEGDWTDRLTGRNVAGLASLAALLDTYPVAILVRD